MEFSCIPLISAIHGLLSLNMCYGFRLNEGGVFWLSAAATGESGRLKGGALLSSSCFMFSAACSGEDCEREVLEDNSIQQLGAATSFPE